MSQELLHFVDRALVLAHVVFGTTALVVGPVAMISAKGGMNHRRAGKIYFYGMVGIFVSTLALAFFRFNIFLFIINILSFYASLTGYRVLYRKNPAKPGQRANWIDWSASLVALASGGFFLAWGVGGMTGVQFDAVYGNAVPTAFYVIGTVAGSSLALSGITDLISYTRTPTTPRWWWYEHMNRFLSAYIATTTAFLVQNVGSRMPLEYSWIVWVAPGVIGGFLVGKWINRYKQQFGDQGSMKVASHQ